MNLSTTVEQLQATQMPFDPPCCRTAIVVKVTGAAGPAGRCGPLNAMCSHEGWQTHCQRHSDAASANHPWHKRESIVCRADRQVHLTIAAGRSRRPVVARQETDRTTVGHPGEPVDAGDHDPGRGNLSTAATLSTLEHPIETTPMLR